MGGGRVAKPPKGLLGSVTIPKVIIGLAGVGCLLLCSTSAWRGFELLFSSPSGRQRRRRRRAHAEDEPVAVLPGGVVPVAGREALLAQLGRLRREQGELLEKLKAVDGAGGILPQEAGAREPQLPPVAEAAPEAPLQEASQEDEDVDDREDGDAGDDEAEAAEPESGQPGKKTQWIYCAGQWQGCYCGGRVKWGNRDKWKVIDLPKGKTIQEVKCSFENLGDILPGDDGKHCQCEVTEGTDFARALNPGLLPTSASRLVSSCELFEKGAGDHAWGKAQWEALEPFCSPKWATSLAGKTAVAGPRAMSVDTMRGLMRSWIDDRFAGVYDKFFDATGWTRYAFLNYYAGPPEGKHTAMTEELIRSVHEFSEHPIIVFHFGVLTPASWTKERFPRLVLIHAAPMAASAGRSFNFNKMRAMLISRTKVGVQLDSDQFVAPGVDAMFKTTEREITQDYPMPILPAHFLDRTPRDTGAYWRRFCPQDKCKWQTARWGHAHPTWTYFAVPWLGRWLRRNFRDETLQSKEGGSMTPLRILDIPEDEDLLNVGTWEDKGTKQWCKLDLPGPDDFAALLDVKPDDLTRCVHGCGDITADRKYHPGGVAKVFYTAHHAVDPPETRKWIAKLIEKRKAGALPPPILYKGRFYKDGDQLRKAHPEIKCII